MQGIGDVRRVSEEGRPEVLVAGQAASTTEDCISEMSDFAIDSGRGVVQQSTS
jgi:hypothetical protein